MHLAIQQGCDLLEDRKEQYRSGRRSHTSDPSWFSSVTGCPPALAREAMEQANQRLVDMESESRLTIFKVAVNSDAVQAMLRTLAQSKFPFSAPAAGQPEVQ